MFFYSEPVQYTNEKNDETTKSKSERFIKKQNRKIIEKLESSNFEFVISDLL